MLGFGGGSSSSTAVPATFVTPVSATPALRPELAALSPQSLRIISRGRLSSAGCDSSPWLNALTAGGCSVVAGAVCALSSSGRRRLLQRGRTVSRVVRAAVSDEEDDDMDGTVAVVQRSTSELGEPRADEDNVALDFARRAKQATLLVGREFKDPITKWNDKAWQYHDVAMINVQAGDGGLGCKSFRREKNMPFGGPDGGNGGHGGHVILECAKRRSTLDHLNQRVHYEAKRGEHGQGSAMHGRVGLNEVIEVPMGSVIYVRDTWLKGQAKGQFAGQSELISYEDISDLHLVGEFTEPGQQIRVARGGVGGRGNLAFKTSRNNAPWLKENGEKGMNRWIEIELKLVADIGLIGLPNAGKSSFLAAVTKATPKVAAYPFSTVKPNLGVYNAEDNGGITLCDVPGLIEGASEGRGMGFRFLRHIERCHCLIHVVDGNSENPVADFMQIQAELRQFSAEVAQKPQVIIVNKCDIPSVQEFLPELMAALRRKSGHTRVFDVSVATRANLDELMKRISKWYKSVAIKDERFGNNIQDFAPVLSARRLAQMGDKMPEVARKEPVSLDEELPKGRHRKGTFQPRVEWDVLEESWRMLHPEVEKIAGSTNWDWEDSNTRFNAVCKSTGMTEALLHAGVQEDDKVIVGTHSFLYMPSMIGAESRMLYYEIDLKDGDETDLGFDTGYDRKGSTAWARNAKNS